MNDDEIIQRQYYTDTADQYDKLHVQNLSDEEHDFALSILSGIIKHLSVKSILDVGAGTGRAISYLKKNHPDLVVVGIEPVKSLREIAFEKGVFEILDGDANKLDYEDGKFDLVCEFGVLHHVRQPEVVVGEMLRVAKKAIFISDSNNFGNGKKIARMIKQTLRILRLWKLITFIRTKGKGYFLSKEDGLFYSYSVFDSHAQIRGKCKSVHYINTKDGGQNLLKSAPQIAVLGVMHKK